MRVLLVESASPAQKLVRLLLCNRFHHDVLVDHVTSFSEAAARLSQDDFDVALVDIDIPGSLGVDSLHPLRAVDARVPIVMLTDCDDETTGLRAIEVGAQDYLDKTFLSGQLLHRSLRFAIARQQKMLGYAAEAHTDALTQLPNRRGLQLALDRVNRTDYPVSIALFDLDHFKDINDQYGHLIGDRALQHVASIFRDKAAETDVVARFGGEEFAVLFSACELETAQSRVHQSLDAIQAKPLTLADSTIQVTSSAGVAELQEGEDFRSVFHRADQALYEAKHAGRNCWRCLQPV